MTWEPATETERRMQDVLRQGDQESYFLLLSGSDLLIPVAPPGSPGAGAWATWSAEDRTHILAFTSDDALRSCLREHAGPCRRVRMDELVQAWPDDEWWLAINPGLPIEGYLPAWFVEQVAAGDVKLPEEARQDAAGWQAEAEHLEPAYSGYGGYEEPSAYQAPPPAPPYGVNSESAYVNTPPLQQRTPPPYTEEPPPYGANNPPPYGAAPSGPPLLPPPQESLFTPAAPASDHRFGDEPYESAFAPRQEQAFQPPEPAFAPPEPAFGAPPEPAFGAPEPAFGTAPEPSYAPPPPYEETPEPVYEEPPRYEPAPEPAPTAHAAVERHDTGPSEDDVESELAAAGAAGDTPRFLRGLLSGWVYVPLNDGAPPGIRPGEPGFTWRTDLIDGAYSLTVFTSPKRLVRRLGDCDYVKVTFVRVARYWPDSSYSLAINPGTEVGANMPGTQMTTLINWANNKGLIEAADMMEQAAESAEAAQRQHALTAGAARRPDPMLLQKLIPAAQVPFYLQRGYDRVAGFVHPAEQLGEFDTPETLRAALGVVHDGASDVYVIRWVSHRADLYRVPYGGNDADEMRRMEGWVIEPPPFRGNGFAPGESAAPIPEFKVDSIRLPHGATMHRLSSIDGDTLVASYDSDQQTWLTAEEPL